jgi:hypothetical protein
MIKKIDLENGGKINKLTLFVLVVLGPFFNTVWCDMYCRSFSCEPGKKSLHQAKPRLFSLNKK